MLLALQMGITNVCTFMIGPERWDASLLYEGVFDKPVQHHNMTHNQKGDGYKDLQKIDVFHMEQYAYIAVADEGDQGIRRQFAAGQLAGHLRRGPGRWGHASVFRPAADRRRSRHRARSNKVVSFGARAAR